jgi:hypothetical protein
MKSIATIIIALAAALTGCGPQVRVSSSEFSNWIPEEVQIRITDVDPEIPAVAYGRNENGPEKIGVHLASAQPEKIAVMLYCQHGGRLLTDEETMVFRGHKDGGKVRVAWRTRYHVIRDGSRVRGVGGTLLYREVEGIEHSFTSN